jgi:hypothetical protein
MYHIKKRQATFFPVLPAWRRLYGEKTVRKAERAWLLSEGEESEALGQKQRVFEPDCMSLFLSQRNKYLAFLKNSFTSLEILPKGRCLSLIAWKRQTSWQHMQWIQRLLSIQTKSPSNFAAPLGHMSTHSIHKVHLFMVIFGVSVS